jgi:hypothetical protein
VHTDAQITNEDVVSAELATYRLNWVECHKQYPLLI